MINRLMTSRKVRGFLLTILILSAITAVLSAALPLNRKKSAVNTLGEQSLSEASSLALSMEYYNGPRIQSLLDYPEATACYHSLCSFLLRAKDTLSYDRAYLLSADGEGNIVYLADADFSSKEGDFRKIGDLYNEPRYNKKCIAILNDQFAGRKGQTFVPEILDKDYIISYLPIHNSQNEVIAVLGVDAKLSYSDFSHYGVIDFEKLMTGSGILFMISLVLFVLCMDKGLSEDEKENRWRKSRGLPPKPLKKDKIVVDPLDDIDPSDYL